MPATDHQVTLITRIGCHLCEQASAVLLRLAGELGYGYEERDVDAEPALRAAWRVNIADLSFRTVTVITLVAMLGLSLFVAFVLPSKNRRTQETDAIEFALVTLLTVMFSPLSFNYAYVVSGSVASKVNDEPEHVYKAGESFFEEPGSRHPVSRNASKTKPASTVLPLA